MVDMRGLSGSDAELSPWCKIGLTVTMFAGKFNTVIRKL
jgi:hypothetical protein